MAAYISDNNILFFIIGVVSGGKGWMFRKVIGGGGVGENFGVEPFFLMFLWEEYFCVSKSFFVGK